MNDATAAATSTGPDGSFLGMIKALFGKGPALESEYDSRDAGIDASYDDEYADEGYFGEYPFRCHGIYGGFGHY